ncbi:helix-turn-helix domain-containing protein [Plantactinospora endophytica]|uniref:Transcriptional regulator n=1 Tax=Plantactinospora endophytica TaxID=673535 RepID=A0ABQ4E360_9ACTN|nr:helix-turn-helix transcriptional regulator [Plantactinospora endophytica]GIG89126.1 transcriptional regulator [Plantactinospora endophytica]
MLTALQQSMIAFIADEIRRARVVANQTQDAFGRVANFSASHVSAVENGTRALTREFVQGADRALATGGLFERMLIKLSLDSEPSWLREWIEIERKAETLRWYEYALIPGLLQTEAYARAIFTSMGVLSAEEITTRVTARMERQALLSSEKPPQLIAVLDEGLLHRPVGGPTVMREQLLHLAKVVAEMPHVRLQVVANSVGAYAGLAGSFVVATLPGGENAAFLDNHLKGVVVQEPADVVSMGKAWESVHSEALPHQQSSKLILEVAERWI